MHANIFSSIEGDQNACSPIRDKVQTSGLVEMICAMSCCIAVTSDLIFIVRILENRNRY